MDAQKTGLLIKKKRQEKKLTQLQLATSLLVTPTAVSKWERGLNFPDIQYIKPLSELLDIPLTELLPDDMLALMFKPSSDEAIINTSATLLSEAHATDGNISPKPKTFSFFNCSKKKINWKVIVISLFCVFLLGATLTAFGIQSKYKTPSLSVVDEYYDDYEGQKAYYIIVEYTEEPTDDDYDRIDNSFRISHADYFETATFIIVIYYEKGNYDKNAIDPFASTSAYTFLYPRSSQETLKGSDSL